MTAEGPAIQILALNLSDIVHPWLFVAAIVVSEMNERLSPKKAPPTIMAVIIGVESPVWVAMPVAMGTNATIVPTEVPMDIEMKQAARNSPARMSFPGSIMRVRFTVASIEPMALAVDANAPARTKIHIIRRTLGFPAPREKVLILSSNVPFDMMTE